MRRAAMKEALSGLIPRRDEEEPSKEASKDTTKEPLKGIIKGTPKQKRRRGFGKVANFYFYPEDIEALDRLVDNYNSSLVARQHISKSDYLRLLIHEKKTIMPEC